MPSEAAITVENVSKAYGLYSALRNLNISFSTGEYCLLVGPNGSGKSTILKLLAGLLSPDAGTITFSDRVARAPIGYTSHESGMYGALTVRENIALFLSLLNDKTPTSTMLEDWNLRDLANRKMWELSKGQQARVSLARASMGAPACLLLDEPSAFLDDESTDALCGKLRTLWKDKLTIIATHDVGRLEQLSPRIINIRNGEVS